MLSILIPTYNYNTVLLVQELYKQACLEQIDFEILVLDDASNDEEIKNQNLKINSISHCRFFVNTTNLGRGQTINKLVSIAKYDLLLILDCDTLPKTNLFINTYLKFNNEFTTKISFGGIIYFDDKPDSNEMLRWVYGRKRESVAVPIRKKNPYKMALTSNLLVKKEVMLNVPFHSQITEYGYEDLVFFLELNKNKIEINHIENPLFHLKLDTSIDFVNKFHSSLQNLKKLSDLAIIEVDDTKITKTFYWLKKCYLVSLVAFAFDRTKKLMIQNLVSKTPYVFVFDLYRLGYFCKINVK